MKRYEYIQMAIDLGDLDQLNRLSLAGFRVAAFIPDEQANFVLLEREVPEQQAIAALQYEVEKLERHPQQERSGQTK